MLYFSYFPVLFVDPSCVLASLVIGGYMYTGRDVCGVQCSKAHGLLSSYWHILVQT